MEQGGGSGGNDITLFLIKMYQKSKVEACLQSTDFVKLFHKPESH